MRHTTCVDCGTADDVRPYGLCAKCVTRWAIRSRRKAGLPLRITRAADVFGGNVRTIHGAGA